MQDNVMKGIRQRAAEQKRPCDRGNCPRRAVITVEASYIVPWSVILLALLITMTFFVHNRVW